MGRSLTLAFRVFACAAALAAITAVDLQLSVNPTTAALTFLIAVLFISAFWGLMLAVLTSMACTLAFNFFFLPPTGTFTIAETQNWVALAAFLVTALLASQLAERARREAAKAISAEAARESERLRAALLDSVAHEFRTPLTGIKAAATALLADVDASSLDRGQHDELLTIIDEETDRLDRLVSAASEMAQLESSAVILSIEAVAAEELVQTALEAASAHLLQHQVTTEIPPGLPHLRVDRQRTTEALRHLLENAGKYSPPATEIAIRAALEGGNVRISVADRGAGIPPDEEKFIFNKFFRSTASRTSVAGSGMGLAIAKALVEAQSGRIGVCSSPSGSTFFVLMPAASATASLRAHS